MGCSNDTDDIAFASVKDRIQFMDTVCNPKPQNRNGGVSSIVQNFEKGFKRSIGSERNSVAAGLVDKIKMVEAVYEQTKSTDPPKSYPIRHPSISQSLKASTQPAFNPNRALANKSQNNVSHQGRLTQSKISYGANPLNPSINTSEPCRQSKPTDIPQGNCSISDRLLMFDKSKGDVARSKLIRNAQATQSSVASEVFNRSRDMNKVISSFEALPTDNSAGSHSCEENPISSTIFNEDKQDTGTPATSDMTSPSVEAEKTTAQAEAPVAKVNVVYPEEICITRRSMTSPRSYSTESLDLASDSGSREACDEYLASLSKLRTAVPDTANIITEHSPDKCIEAFYRLKNNRNFLCYYIHQLKTDFMALREKMPEAVKNARIAHQSLLDANTKGQISGCDLQTLGIRSTDMSMWIYECSYHMHNYRIISDTADYIEQALENLLSNINTQIITLQIVIEREKAVPFRNNQRKMDVWLDRLFAKYSQTLSISKSAVMRLEIITGIVSYLKHPITLTPLISAMRERGFNLQVVESAGGYKFAVSKP